jgi:hypothetical protein
MREVGLGKEHKKLQHYLLLLCTRYNTSPCYRRSNFDGASWLRPLQLGVTSSDSPWILLRQSSGESILFWDQQKGLERFVARHILPSSENFEEMADIREVRCQTESHKSHPPWLIQPHGRPRWVRHAGEIPTETPWDARGSSFRS